jgi:hypothetical protein
MILQASIHRVAPNGILAALVLKVDTIPKPDGLGVHLLYTSIEQNSNDFGACSRRIESCQNSFEF